MRISIVLFLITQSLFATNWVASTNLTVGVGTTNNPWNLQQALTNASVVAGDTLYLRGGNYYAPFFSTLAANSNSYITVRSFPGERAVITDGPVYRLGANLPNNSSDIHTQIMKNAATNWAPGVQIMVGTELIIYYSLANGWIRGWNGTTIAAHNSNDVAVPQNDFIYHIGSYVAFRDFDITSVLSTNRYVDTSNQNNFTNYFGSGLNLNNPGRGNKAINLVIYNVGHPGIGLWEQSDGGEISGCLIWGCGYWDTSPSYNELRGAGVYTQNHEGTVNINNNMIFANLTEGVHAYGASVSVSGYRFVNDFWWNNLNGQSVLIGTTTYPANDNQVISNYSIGNTPVFGYIARTNTNLTFKGNVLVNHASVAFTHQTSGMVVSNTYLFDQSLYPGNGFLQLTTIEVPYSLLNFSWNYNTYYAKNNQPDLFYINTMDLAPVGKINFTGGTGGTNNWVAWSRYDSNSTYTASWPTTLLNVKMTQMDYDANRYFISVVNNTVVTNTNVRPPTFNIGDRWILRDAQNYFTIVSQGNYGGAITLPFTLTAASTVSGTILTNTHTASTFNAFVLDNLGPTTMNVTALNIGQ